MATPSPPSTSAVRPPSAEPSNAKAKETREYPGWSITKTTPLQGLSWRNTSPTPAEQGVGEIDRRQPDGPAPARGLLQAGVDRGARMDQHRVDQLRRVQLAELVEGEQQQPGRQDKRGGQRCHVPADEQFREPHHYDRRDDS